MLAEPVVRQHPGGSLVLQRPRRELEQPSQLLGREQRIRINRNPLDICARQRRNRDQTLNDLIRQNGTHHSLGSLHRYPRATSTAPSGTRCPGCRRRVALVTPNRRCAPHRAVLVVDQPSDRPLRRYMRDGRNDTRPKAARRAVANKTSAAAMTAENGQSARSPRSGGRWIPSREPRPIARPPEPTDAGRLHVRRLHAMCSERIMTSPSRRPRSLPIAVSPAASNTSHTAGRKTWKPPEPRRPSTTRLRPIKMNEKQPLSA